MIPSKAAILKRAKQLFEEETVRRWDLAGSDRSEDRKSLSATDEEKAVYLERAERELKDIDQEGHS